MMESELALEIGILHSSFSFAATFSRKGKRRERKIHFISFHKPTTKAGYWKQMLCQALDEALEGSRKDNIQTANS